MARRTAARAAPVLRVGLTCLDLLVLACGPRSGHPVEPRNLGRSFERLRDAAGLRPIRLHDLRHTTATLVKDLGVPPRDTMEILGHARIAVTMEICTAADDGSRRDAIGKLNQLLRPDRP